VGADRAANLLRLSAYNFFAHVAIRAMGNVPAFAQPLVTASDQRALHKFPATPMELIMQSPLGETSATGFLFLFVLKLS